jgi:hypothetical protein
MMMVMLRSTTTLLLLVLLVSSLVSAKLHRAPYKFPNSTPEVALTDGDNEHDADADEQPLLGPDGGVQVLHVGTAEHGGYGKKRDNEYIFKVARRVVMQPIVDDFLVTFPHANVTHVFTNAYHGFSVKGVTEAEVRNFANTCGNVVLQIQENAEVHIANPVVPSPGVPPATNAATSAAAAPEWGLDRIDARQGLDQAYAPSANGAGVKIYVIDTGVRVTHSEFAGRITEGRDFTGEGQFDGNGHGTHVVRLYMCIDLYDLYSNCLYSHTPLLCIKNHMDTGWNLCRNHLRCGQASHDCARQGSQHGREWFVCRYHCRH